jgi:GNAT superfamily N-acetyltransferase
VKLRCVPAAEADAQTFIAGANLAFGEWGDGKMYAWAFRGDACLLLLDDDAGRTVAGSAIVYRTIRHPDGALQRGAIMTASWTLPAARGRGAFTRMIEATCDVARERNVTVLGFGRVENASRRRFEAARATLYPSFYCRSIESRGSGAVAQPLDRLDPDPALFARAEGGSSFVYEADEWRTQFLDRPAARIECVGRRGEWAAIVEHATGFDRVHLISDAAALPLLAPGAHARGCRLFCYTTVAAQANALAAAGFEWNEGFVTELPGTAVSDWDFQNGDRM